MCEGVLDTHRCIKQIPTTGHCVRARRVDGHAGPPGVDRVRHPGVSSTPLSVPKTHRCVSNTPSRVSNTHPRVSNTTLYVSDTLPRVSSPQLSVSKAPSTVIQVCLTRVYVCLTRVHVCPTRTLMITPLLRVSIAPVIQVYPTILDPLFICVVHASMCV